MRMSVAAKCLFLVLTALIFQSAYGQNRQMNRKKYQWYSDGADMGLQKELRFLALKASTTTTTTTTAAPVVTITTSPTTTSPTTTTPTTTTTTSPAPTARSFDNNPYYEDDDSADLDEIDEIDLPDTYADDLIEPHVSQVVQHQNKQRIPIGRAEPANTNCEQQLRRQLQQIWRRNQTIRRRANIERNQQAWRRRMQQNRQKHQQNRRRENLRRRRRQWYNRATASL